MGRPPERSGDAPLLSVLVPTYNQAHWMGRIVASMGNAAQSCDVELRVHDDSTDDRVAGEIEAIVRSCRRGVYRRNQTSRGAVPNWNGLLDAAEGDYCLLMHHDEYFETPEALQDALTALRTGAGDGVIFPCRVVSSRYPNGRLHMPAWLTRWIVISWPGYMLRRNPLGAPSTLLLRREYYPRYDERLRWLVDCELYVRAVSEHSPRLTFLTGKGVMSEGSAATSITASLGPSISQIRKHELTLLCAQGLPPARGAWLVSRSLGAAAARAVEALAWTAFRSAQRLAQIATRGR